MFCSNNSPAVYKSSVEGDIESYKKNERLLMTAQWISEIDQKGFSLKTVTLYSMNIMIKYSFETNDMVDVNSINVNSERVSLISFDIT